ncbi:M23 family metallopeptidase [Cellulosilyticum ruminicola]|uniref:M23 family metallopeptidase n=1 Tax=Cellulosilyticum ruminicola TaxID=425254 RepID=UPI0006D2051F|nr:M23 family metallopeptidase [Cellulosilyticum ruminicola]
MKQWKKHLCGMLIVAAVPGMIYAANITQSTSSAVTVSPNVEKAKEEIKFISPIKVEAELTAPFDQDRTSYSHQGIDLKMPIGTPVYAAADGKVIKAAPDSKGINAGGGNIIMLVHADGSQTWYMHLDAYAVNLGNNVKQGQIIGFSGNTGDSSAPHLHLEYRVNGIPLDPRFIIENKQYVDKSVSLIKLDEPFIVVQS